MRSQGERRDSKSFVVVDEDCGIPTSLVESYRGYSDNGPLAQADPRSVFLSMSEYDKSQGYDVYDYHPTSTRPEQGPDYSAFVAPQQAYTGDYVGTAAQAQVPSGLPQSAAGYTPIAPPQHHYGTHDPTYYAQPNVQYPAYQLDTAPPPRPLPEILSWSPNQGPPGTKVTVHFRSAYDFDNPQVTPTIMFGQKRCQSTLNRTAQHQAGPYHYALSADAPPLTPTNTPSPQVSLLLNFDDGIVAWQSPVAQFGSFTYLDPMYSVESPPSQSKKRKLDPQASPRLSPSKKPSLQQMSGSISAVPSATPTSPFRRPSIPDMYGQTRRFSVPDTHAGYNTAGLSRVQSQQYYGGIGQTPPSLQTVQSPSWSYAQNVQSTTRSPSAATLSGGSKASLLPSPAGSNPPLIRTSTLQQSPTTPVATTPATQTFNPYAMYPSKAVLKLDGELNSMADHWTPAEWEVKRRLVQFRRSQSGSIINATFEPVTLEDRIPNSICVSCIWWEEKQECYVTSVDTISLLESLVAVRFTVEEKNRIRRNLEGFRPATVSKTKADSEEFFKLVMGFPNPKPRNIEKDVKVFPWRILATALKKIIGKYASHPRLHCMTIDIHANAHHLQSASYSSTAGVLHTPSAAAAAAGPSYSTGGRPSDAGMEQHRPIASPHSTSSSATSHGHAYAAMAPTATTYSPHAMGMGPSAGGPPDLRLAVPQHAATTTSWHTPSAHYSTDLSATGRGTSWDFGGGGGGAHAAYISASPASAGMQPSSSSAPSYQQYAPRYPALSTSQPGVSSETRFVPLHGYGDAQSGLGQPTTSGAQPI